MSFHIPSPRKCCISSSQWFWLAVHHMVQKCPLKTNQRDFYRVKTRYIIVPDVRPPMSRRSWNDWKWGWTAGMALVETSKKDGTLSLLLPLGESSRFNLLMSTTLTLLHAQHAGLHQEKHKPHPRVSTNTNTGPMHEKALTNRHSPLHTMNAGAQQVKKWHTRYVTWLTLTVFFVCFF